MGATAASAKATILASGVTFSLLAASAVIRTRAAAPSFKVLALAAVTVPFSFWKTVFSLGTLLKSTRLHSSSSLTTTSGFPLCGMWTGTISLASNPDSHAALLRVYELMA
uniref:Uncharacterized protein n=1 Tax=Anguilla anguilla TaxID=7936 RepID=A0A0E9XEA9_ANGAN